MTQGTLVKVKGVVIELKGTKTGTKRGRDWKRYDFTVKQLTGQTANCNTFGSFDKELIGKTVEFDAEFNERFSNYAVKSEIEVLEDQEVNAGPTGPELAPTTKRRGRPRKSTSVVAHVQEPVVQQRTVESDLEGVRKQAVDIFTQDVDDVFGVLKSYVNDDEVTPQALTVGVQALQAIRATLFIEANKRERVSAMRS